MVSLFRWTGLVFQYPVPIQSSIMSDPHTISILIPTLNEEEHISACLGSVLGQTYPIHEVLVLDGGSTDRTRQLVSRYGPPVRLIDNPGRGPAAAMNTGIRASTGEVVCRMDAHTVFEPDYVARCVEVLGETGAAVVGGPMRPQGQGRFGKAVAAVTSSRVAMPGRFHFATTRTEADTVYLGTWKRSTLLDAGGFDAEHFPWWGEDNELNYRLRTSGWRVIVDPRIRSTYFPRERPRDLWRQYYRYGLAKATSLAVHRRLPSWRPLAPAGLVALAFGAVILGRKPRWRLFVPAVHGLGCVAVGVSVSRGTDSDPMLAAVVQEICHWSFGVGFWVGVGKVIRGRPAQSPISDNRHLG